MGAGSGDPLGIDATNVQELGSRAKYGEAAAETDNRMIDQLARARRAAAAARPQDLEKQKADAQKRQDEADAARREVEKINAKMQSLLASTKSDIVTLASQIETDRIAAQAAAERARIQAEAAPRRPRPRRSSGGGGIGGFSSNPADTGIDPGNIPAPSSGASAQRSRTPRAQIGKPYVYAGAGPGVVRLLRASR